MSIYGYFSCVDCQVIVWLGKAVYKVVEGERTDHDKVYYYKVGGAETPPNAQEPILNRTIWKMLADHQGHRLRVTLDFDAEFDTEDAEFSEIGGDTARDIPFDEYLKDWSG